MILKADVGKVHATAEFSQRGLAHGVLDAIDQRIRNGELVGISANVWAPMEMAGQRMHPWYVTVLGEEIGVVERAHKVMRGLPGYTRDAECPRDVLAAQCEKRWLAIREHGQFGFHTREPSPERPDGAFLRRGGTVEYVDSVR